jgi:D-glycero-D-manno-heptose 1,7-bisphosphate phosphatase
MARLILLDRDGVINHDSPDYIKHVDEWVPLPGAIEAIVALKRAGFLVGVCTNQAGLARGLLSEPALAAIHDRLHRLLAAQDTALDDLRFCPHGPDAGCGCRKPRPGMLVAAMRALRVAPSDTLFVGDAVRDVEAALAAGCRPVLVRSGTGADAEAAARALGVTWVAEDLAEVARVLIGDTGC